MQMTVWWTPSPTLKVDLCLYACAALLSVAAVLGPYYAPPVEAEGKRMDHYMEQILGRMDSVSAQLAQWGSIDIRHDL